MKNKYYMKKASLAVSLVLMTSLSITARAAEDDEQPVDDELEEVVVTGSRLQGSAQAVLDERKNQAFVADILGAEQISRTGDSDAASALRRVTGLTLVDGKFIYIRGLGERYSSTQLDGMSVPSPDPTRTVLPLDLFPSSIIESLNVQKAYSPDLPAHFAGGNVDIRIKSIPNEKVFRIGGSLGFNSNSGDEAPWYEGGGDDWKGDDDGTRALSSAFSQALQGDGVNNLASEDAVGLLSTLNRNISAQDESIDPNYGINITYGDQFGVGEESQIGFLSAISYKNSWQVSNERNVNNLARTSNGIAINEFADGPSTEHKIKLSAMFNFGFSYNENHKVEINNMLLLDTRDRLRNRLLESTNTINELDEERRQLDIVYEERELFSSQVSGSHNFPSWKNLGVDWYYSTSSAERRAPGGLEAFFRSTTEDGITTERLAADVDTKYSFQNLEDDAKNYGVDISLPLYFDGFSVELKAGADFIEKDRDAESIDIAIQTFSIPSNFLLGSDYSDIFSDDNLTNPDFAVRLDDQTAPGDKYKAATLNDAYYFLADIDLSSHWRLTGGVRYEDFRQVSVPFQPHSNFFSVEGQEITDLAFMEDDFFPSLGVTYIMDSEMQLRFNYSQTAIRPDLRDVSTSFYIDPLTEFLVRGSTSLQSSIIDNFDARFEWYMADGGNFSVAIFGKDIQKPIEQIELPSSTEGAPQLLTANAEDGQIIGVEFDFLKDLTFIGGDWSNYFVSGNLTYSDSEVNICSGVGAENCLFEEQLKEALNTQQSVTSVITSNTRRLIGHSEWVVNLQAGWDSLDNEHAATLVYNVFGPRIIIPGANGFEDAKENSFHSLDLVYTWYPSYDSTLKVRLKNILDEEKNIEQEGVDILKESVGTELSISYSMNF